jgi:molybdate transport system substrate-binding protein
MQGRLLLSAAMVLIGTEACDQHKTPAAPTVKVAAAADLALAFQEIGQTFAKSTGIHTVFSFGSTGLLAQQLIEGAPYDLFAAANVEFVDRVVKSGACDPSTEALYAIGRMAIWTKTDAPLAPPASIRDLADPRFQKIAIANPSHAPYGRAAEEALERAEVDRAVKPKLVFGENVQQALQFAQTGNADAAIVSLSLALPVAGGRYSVIDADLHSTIRQAMVVCGKREKTEAARRFAAFVTSRDGRAIMRRYGFLLPGETVATAP